MKLSSFRKKPSPKTSAPSKKEKLPPIRIMSLDPALRNCGVVLMDGEGVLIKADTIKNPAPKKGEERSKLADYNKIVKEVILLVQNQLHHNVPLFVIREDYAFSAASSSDTLLKELGGILEWEINKQPGVYLHWVGIGQAKKWACGKGNAEKDEVIAGIKSRFKFEGDEHQCDAYSIATLSLEVLRPGTFKLDSKQKEVIDSMGDHSLTLERRRAR